MTVTHVDWIDYTTGKVERREVFDRSFLEHAAKTGSQYDGTCRLMAAHILALLDAAPLAGAHRAPTGGDGAKSPHARHPQYQGEGGC